MTHPAAGAVQPSPEVALDELGDGMLKMFVHRLSPPPAHSASRSSASVFSARRSFVRCLSCMVIRSSGPRCGTEPWVCPLSHTASLLFFTHRCPPVYYGYAFLALPRRYSDNDE